MLNLSWPIGENVARFSRGGIVVVYFQPTNWIAPDKRDYRNVAQAQTVDPMACSKQDPILVP